MKHFEKVRGKVNGTFEELNDWIDENLATTESEVLQNTRLTGTKALLTTALDKGYGKVVKHKSAAAAEELRGAAEQAAIKTTQDASANPQVHARKARPSDKVIDRKRGKGKSGKLEKKTISKEKLGKNATKLGAALLPSDSPPTILRVANRPARRFLQQPLGLLPPRPPVPVESW